MRQAGPVPGRRPPSAHLKGRGVCPSCNDRRMVDEPCDRRSPHPCHRLRLKDVMLPSRRETTRGITVIRMAFTQRAPTGSIHATAVAGAPASAGERREPRRGPDPEPGQGEPVRSKTYRYPAGEELSRVERTICRTFPANMSEHGVIHRPNGQTQSGEWLLSPRVDGTTRGPLLPIALLSTG